MKLLKKQISAKDASGMILVRPDTPEDLWHAFNLLQTGDRVRCTTVRKVIKESSTGSTVSSKKRCMLTVAVHKVDFDPEALELRLSGVVESENDLVRMGAHHTLTLELNQNFSIEKDCWDQIYLDLVEEAINPEKQAEIAAIVLQQTGLAHVCLVTGALTITKARIDINIPKKRTGSSQHQKAMTKFYNAVYQAVLRHIDFAKVKCVVVGSPGFVKNDFYEYLQQQSLKREDKVLQQNKNKFILCNASSGHKHALEEVFQDPTVVSQMTETKVAKEVEVLQKFMRILDTDPDKAYYGYDHVLKAQEQLAIDSLLVTDELFRASDVPTRKKYVMLVESVRNSGGQVFVFSSMHVSGQQLQQVSGVAAILRFPLPDLDEMEEIAAQVQEEVNNMDGDDDEQYDPEKRIREDVEDMGL